MIVKNRVKNWIKKAIFGLFFAIVGVCGVMGYNTSVYAEPVTETATEEEITEVIENGQENTGNSTNSISSDVSCKDSLGGVGWFVCPGTGKIAEATDWLYEKIEDILVINPVEIKDGSPIYEI